MRFLTVPQSLFSVQFVSVEDILQMITKIEIKLSLSIYFSYGHPLMILLEQFGAETTPLTELTGGTVFTDAAHSLFSSFLIKQLSEHLNLKLQK
jgi:hypothetical protein